MYFNLNTYITNKQGSINNTSQALKSVQEFNEASKILTPIFKDLLDENVFAHLVFLWVNASPEERGLPAVHILLRVTCQLDLTQVFVHIPDDQTPR